MIGRCTSNREVCLNAERSTLPDVDSWHLFQQIVDGMFRGGLNIVSSEDRYMLTVCVQNRCGTVCGHFHIFQQIFLHESRRTSVFAGCFRFGVDIGDDGDAEHADVDYLMHRAKGGVRCARKPSPSNRFCSFHNEKI